MAEPKIDTAAEAAEKAYAAAASAKLEAAPAVAAPAVVVTEAPLAFPARVQPVDASPAAKPVETVTAPMAPVETVVVEVASAPLTAETAKPASKAAPAKAVKPKAAKPAPAKIAKPAAPVAKKAAPAKKAATIKKAPAVKAAKPKIPTTPKTTPILQSKEKLMATKKKTTDFTADLKSAVADVQVKAKEVLAKGNFVLGEATSFTKGNVDAIVESGKILAAGLQGLGKGYVAEGKAAVETVTADVKELATVKSPTDFVQLQSRIARRNLDQAFAFGAKNSEAVFKLFNDTFAPLSKRASLAVETIKKAA